MVQQSELQHIRKIEKLSQTIEEIEQRLRDSKGLEEIINPDEKKVLFLERLRFTKRMMEALK